VRVSDVVILLDANVLAGRAGLEREVLSAGGCDIISDLLIFGKPGMLLLTGLTQLSVVKTAHLLDIAAVVFAGGKTPGGPVIDLAESLGLPLLLSPHSLYDCCGRLYARGLQGVVGSTGRLEAGCA
jgi:predicted transcriptional regulator